MRVTFDTNAIDRAVRPERFPKDLRRAEYLTVNNALKDKRIHGFISDTLFSIEGMQKLERAGVFGGTYLKVTEQIHVEEADNGLVTKIDIQYHVNQPGRKPLHPEMARRISAAVGIGMRFLSAPRIGAIKIIDSENKLYVSETEQELGDRINLYHEALRAIQARGVGIELCKQLGESFSKRDGKVEPWFKGLDRAQDVHEENAVARAFAEWADADAIAAHIGYGIDYFCTEDAGKSAGAASILDATNSSWLRQVYRVQFITLAELSKMVSAICAIYARVWPAAGFGWPPNT